jgi:glycosyltransferase involved in cell wall biosynthesis
VKLLYAYRYGIIGGVSTQLRLRQKALKGAGIECRLFFSQDNGLGQVLSRPDDIHFGTQVSFSRLLRTEGFDAVVVIDSPELLGPARGPLFRRNRVFLDVHTTTTTGLAYLSEVDVSSLAGVMVPTRYSDALVQRRVPNSSIEVVPNILNTGVFSPSGESRVADSDGTREFIWVGKLDNHKNWRLALVYARLLCDLFGDVKLHVVGGYTAPAERAEGFFQLAYRLGVSDRVSWLDRVENTTLAQLYRQCAASGGAMLVTSRDESFGMAAAEALLCGCPLIANDLPVFREVFPGSPLIHLVDIWQPEQLAQAAQALSLCTLEREVTALHDELSRRYGPESFLASFKRLMSVSP